MDTQASLFHASPGHDGAPPRVTPASGDRGPSTSRKGDALRTMRGLRAGSMQAALLDLYTEARDGTLPTRSGAPIRGLTDDEAAAHLTRRLGRTRPVKDNHVCAPRNALMTSHGVVPLGRRRSHLSGSTRNAYGLPPEASGA